VPDQWGWDVVLNANGTMTATSPDRTRTLRSHSPPVTVARTRDGHAAGSYSARSSIGLTPAVPPLSRQNSAQTYQSRATPMP